MHKNAPIPFYKFYRFPRKSYPRIISELPKVSDVVKTLPRARPLSNWPQTHSLHAAGVPSECLVEPRGGPISPGRDFQDLGAVCPLIPLHSFREKAQISPVLCREGCKRLWENRLRVNLILGVCKCSWLCCLVYMSHQNTVRLQHKPCPQTSPSVPATSLFTHGTLNSQIIRESELVTWNTSDLLS